MTDHRDDHQDLAGLRYAGYLRVSRANQVEGISLQLQESEVRRWAEERGMVLASREGADGSTQPAMFYEVFTGTKYDRPQMKLLLDLAERRLVDAVVVRRIDRFARDEVVFLLLERIFEQHGVRLFSVDEGEFTPGAGNPFIAANRRAAVEGDLHSLANRVHSAHRHYIRQGQVCPTGIGPFGYVKVGKGKKRHLERVPEEGKIALLIFELYPAKGLNAIASHLDREGIVAPSKQRGMKKPGSGKWSAQMVRKILMNPVYIGRWTTYDYIEGQKGLTQEQRQKLGAREIVVEVEPTVPLELWERAQQALAERKEEFRERFANQERQQFYLLGGLVRCRACKRSMHSTSTPQDAFGRVYRYYQCAKCKTRAPGSIDDRVWQFVRELLRDADDLVARYRQGQRRDEERRDEGRHDERRERLAAVDELLAAHGRERERVLELFRQGRIDDERMERELQDLRRVMEGLREERRRWQELLDAAPDDEEAIAELRRLALMVRELGDEGQDERREVVEALGLSVRLERHDKSGAHKPRITLYVRIHANVWRLDPDGGVEELGEQPADEDEERIVDSTGRSYSVETFRRGNWISALRGRRE